MKPEDPQVAAEWQQAVDDADACLTIDAAQKYGLITTTLKINAERCEEILRRGRAQGITPRSDAIERFVEEARGGDAR